MYVVTMDRGQNERNKFNILFVNRLTVKISDLIKNKLKNT